MPKNKQDKEVFTVQFDLVIPVREALNPEDRTLPQYEVFELVKKQLKASFDTEVCHTQNYKLARKITNELTKQLDKEGKLI